MIRLRYLALVFLLLAVATTVAVDAKPLYCNYQCYAPYYNGPDDICTCPPGTIEFGDIITCQDYFWNYCNGAMTQSTPMPELEEAPDGEPVSATEPESTNEDV